VRPADRRADLVAGQDHAARGKRRPALAADRADERGALLVDEHADAGVVAQGLPAGGGTGQREEEKDGGQGGTHGHNLPLDLERAAIVSSATYHGS